MNPFIIMDTQNDQEVEETLDLPEATDETEEDTTDWKAEAQKLQQKAIRQREKTKELKAKLAEKETVVDKAVKTPDKPTDFDYGQKAFLKSYGIDGADERELVKTFMSRTGDDLDTVINDDILQAKLKSLRDAKVAKEAVPSSTGRSASAQGNKLDYWLAKYQTSGNLAEVPKELQRDVLNARLKAEEQTRKFG